MSLAPPIRVVGVGSANGDDALAWEAVRQIQKLVGADLECHWIEGGQRLLDLLDGRGSLLLVDAMVAGAPPGEIQRLIWPDPRIDALRPGSTHDLRPAAALRLAESLGLLPPCVVIFGVEAAQFGPELTLSPEVIAAIPDLVDRMVVELVAG